MPPKQTKQILGAAMGLAIGLMIMYIGFFRTLLLVALGAAGWWLCGSRTIPQPVKDWLERMKNMRQ